MSSSPPTLIKSQFTDAIIAGPGQLELYLNGVAASKSARDVASIKRCIDPAVQIVLPYCTVQGAGSTYRGVAIEEVGLQGVWEQCPPDRQRLQPHHWCNPARARSCCRHARAAARCGASQRCC
jgi:hypothetical protein